MLSAASPRLWVRSGETRALTVRKKYDTKCASAKGRSTLASIRCRLLRFPTAACTGSTDGVLLKAYSLSCCACQAAGLRNGRRPTDFTYAGGAELGAVAPSVIHQPKLVRRGAHLGKAHRLLLLGQRGSRASPLPPARPPPGCARPA